MTLVETFSHPIIEVDEMLLLETEQARHTSSSALKSDRVSVEATLNKRYVADLVGHAFVDDANRDELMICGRAIMHVWSECIALRFPGRVVVFYLGGRESVILRFHVRRPGVREWTDLSDREFLSQSLIEVFLLEDGKLERLPMG